ncbi:hypothetical protein ACE1CI_32985 [Aerosakkonemataceae cyanobacterium BLCC-F50]|uniref:Uncharacterized protein n=1 Tax=Floridaenema flaviceps BLCC-F50 TaxID=3153642 RepID=A0ABV4Y197_9CYAN
MNKLKILQSTKRVLLIYLIAIDLTLASIYLISTILFGKAIRDFDFDIPRTIPVLFAACKLFAIGFLLTLASCWRRHELPKRSWWLLLAVGTAFLYVSQDKIWKFHLLIRRFSWMPEFKGGGIEWVFFYLPIILLTIVLGYRQLIALWRAYPRSTFFTVLGIVMFLMGGIGVEVIHAQFFKQYVAQIAISLNSTTAIVNSVKDTIEELTELLGESITLFGLTLFFSFRLAERDGEMGKMESKI